VNKPGFVFPQLCHASPPHKSEVISFQQQALSVDMKIWEYCSWIIFLRCLKLMQMEMTAVK